MNKEILNYAKTLEFRSEQGDKYFFDILAGKKSADEQLLCEHSNRKSTGSKRFLALVDEAWKFGNKLLMVKEFESIFSEEAVATKTFTLSKPKKKKPEPQSQTQSLPEPQPLPQPQPIPTAFAGFGSIEGFYGGLQGFLNDKTQINNLHSDLRFANREIEILKAQMAEMSKKNDVLQAKNENLDSEVREGEREVDRLKTKIGLGSMVANGVSSLALRVPQLKTALGGFLGVDLDGEPEQQAIAGNSQQNHASQPIPVNIQPNAADPDYPLKCQFVQAIADFVQGVPKDDFIKLYKVIQFCTTTKDNLNLIHDLCQQPVNQA
jgi:hypothetical protein